MGYDRVSTFLDSLYRSFSYLQSDNYVLVTHGISIRVFLTRFFHYTTDEFNTLANSTNCESIVLVNNGSGEFQLHGRYELDSHNSTNNNSNSGKATFHKTLRTLPKEVRRVRRTSLHSDNAPN